MIASEIFKDFDISTAALELIRSEFKEVSYKKGDIILDMGSNVTYQYYVQNGCLRTFFEDEKGKEHTL